MEKKKLLLIFSDIDGTILPAKGSSITEFSKKIFDIQQETNAQIKFIPITGRNVGHTRAVSQMIDYNLKEEGVKEPIDFSFGEQGAAYIDAKSQVKHEFIGDKNSVNLKERLKDSFEKSRFKKYFEQCPLNQYSSAFVMKPETTSNLKGEDKSKLRADFINYLERNFGDKMLIKDSGAIEVTPPGVSKEDAILHSLKKYRDKYNIAGIVYCGDSGNDLSAIKYVSTLSLGSGIKSYVFTPSNSNEIVASKNVEAWKDRLEPKVEKNIEKASKETLDGIIELFTNKKNPKEFLGTGLDSKVRDDIGIKNNRGSKEKFTL